MSHILVKTDETVTDMVFTCALCGQVIGFNRIGIGVPCVDEQGNPPEDADNWMSPCTS